MSRLSRYVALHSYLFYMVYCYSWNVHDLNVIKVEVKWSSYDIYYILADIPVIAHDIMTCPQKM